MFSVSVCLGQDSEVDQEAEQAMLKTIETAAETSNVLLPSPPLDFHILRHPVVLKETFVGFNVLAQKEGSITKVLIKVDLREDADFSIRGWRSGAVKGYINGLADALVASGYRVIKKNIPEIDGSTLTEELIVDVEFENSDGAKIYLNQRIFFDTRGFAIAVIADNREEFEILLNWANKIQASKQ